MICKKKKATRRNEIRQAALLKSLYIYMFKKHRGVTLNLVAALHSLLDDATHNCEKQEHCSHHTFEEQH